MVRAVVCLRVVAGSGLEYASAGGGAGGRGSQRGEVLLERWQAEAARQWAEKRLVSEPHHPVWRFLLGQALFELGRYTEALATFDRLLQHAPHPRIQAYREFVAQTIQSTATLQLLETAHFHIWLDPDKDAALMPYVGEVLEQSYQRLGDLVWFHTHREDPRRNLSDHGDVLPCLEPLDP